MPISSVTTFYAASFSLIILAPLLLCLLAMKLPYEEPAPFAEFAWDIEGRARAGGAVLEDDGAEQVEEGQGGRVEDEKRPVKKSTAERLGDTAGRARNGMSKMKREMKEKRRARKEPPLDDGAQ